jgi:hypothetical protein
LEEGCAEMRKISVGEAMFDPSLIMPKQISEGEFGLLTPRDFAIE